MILGLFVCLSGPGTSLKTYCKDSSPLRDRTNLPAKYANMSNVCHDEKMRYDVTLAS